MAKQKATNQPITADEPIRPEEQFQLDESEVAPPSPRPVGAKTTVAGSTAKTYGARSARERRISSTNARRSKANRRESGLRPDIVNNMLEHPSIVVTEAQLREEYTYVLTDLRSMFIVAAALIVGLIVLAQILPS